MQRSTDSIDAGVVSANRMEPTFAVDTVGSVAFANERFYAVSGLTPDATIGADLSVVERIVAEGFDGLRRAVRTVVSGESDDERVELRMRHPEDAPVPRHLPAEARVTPIRSGVTDLGVLVSVREIETRKQYERRLERQNERLEGFARMVAHDLRSPMNVAEGRLELAESSSDAEHLDVVRDALGRMRDILDGTLTLAKQGRRVGAMDAVSLSALASRCWDTVETPNATLSVDGDDAVLADADRLKHLLENLFRNSVEHGSTDNQVESGDSVAHGSTGSRTESDDAAEHGRREAAVRVRLGVLREGDDPVGFYVEDDGPGIPEDERERVFESGYTTDPNGTGYGLRIVEWVAEAHGWTVSVTDGADGGARFEFTGVEFV